MTRSFGNAAVSLGHVAAALLGWRPNDFWEATPAELAACLNLSGEDVGPVNSDTIEQLRQRFPD